MVIISNEAKLNTNTNWETGIPHPALHPDGKVCVSETITPIKAVYIKVAIHIFSRWTKRSAKKRRKLSWL